MTPIEAKAVLDQMRLKAEAPFATFDEKREHQALAAMISEIVRLTAPLDADEGRRLVEELRMDANTFDDHEPDGTFEAAAAYIERQAAREADRARVDAEVRAKIEALNIGPGGHYTEGFRMGHDLAIDAAIAILDTAKSVPPSGGSAKTTPDLAKPRREVEALLRCQQIAAIGIEDTDDTGPLADLFAAIHREAASALASPVALIDQQEGK
jgi:hypothetical protein